MNADLAEPFADEDVRAAHRHRGAGHAAHERVRRARRQSEVERQQVPSDRADQAAEHDADGEHLLQHDVLGDRVGDVGVEHEERGEVEEGRPRDGEPRGQHARADHGGDGVRGVVEAVRVVERERDRNDEHDRGTHGGSAAYACFKTMDSTTSLMSSTALSAASIACDRSFHLMTSSASNSPLKRRAIVRRWISSPSLSSLSIALR